jgi:hypothetical protein
MEDRLMRKDYDPGRLVLYHLPLVRVFGDHYRQLTDALPGAIREDIALIIDTEQRTAEDACKVLRSRIGGAENLRAYARCLVAGRTRD